MKKLSLLFVLFAIALTGCITKEIEVRYVEVTPTGQPAAAVIPPTAVPPTAVPTYTPAPAAPAAPATGGIWTEVQLPPSVMDHLLGQGFRFIGADNTGKNGCTADQCIHFVKEDIGQVLSFFYFDGKISGVISSADMNKSDGTEPGQHFGYTATLVEVPQNIFNLLMDQLGDAEFGNREVGGWRTIVKVDADSLIIGVVKIGAQRIITGNPL